MPGHPEVSIGVLAHNEGARIGATLQGLFGQDIFKRCSTEVVVVANGCTDHTAALAKARIPENTSSLSLGGTMRVVEIPVAGKSNAWNEFVHEFSSLQAEVLFLMDADIALAKSDVLFSMLATLRGNPEAVICVDTPIKDITLRPDRTLVQRLLMSATPEVDPDNPDVCGQLYCARSGALREIRLPVELTVEDGFLRALLLTRGFTGQEDKRRITLDRNASHIFTSVGTLRETFKHEVRVVAGSIVNMLLFEHFAAKCGPSKSAMALMENWSAEDSNWLKKFISGQVEERGWRLLPRSWWTRRWSRLARMRLLQRVLRVPSAALAALLDAFVFLTAMRYVRSGRAFGYWGRDEEPDRNTRRGQVAR